MTPWWVTIIVAVIGFAGGYLIFKNRQSENATNREGIVSEAAMQLLQPYRDEVKNLRAEVAVLKERVNELQRRVNHTISEVDCVTAGAHLLHHQVIALGGKPIYDPPERRKDDEEDGT